MTQSAIDDDYQMTSGVRTALYVASALLFCLGLLAIYVLIRLMLFERVGVYQTAASRDLIFLGLWAVVALCFVAIGVNLFKAAQHRLNYDIIPGPTLYALGVTLVIIGMFLISSSSFIAGGVLGLVGFGAMWLEYSSTFI